MPTWTLTYRIGVDCTNDEFYQEQELLQSDRACVRCIAEQSWLEPGLVHVRAEFSDWIGISPQSNTIMRRRNGEAEPAIPFLARTQILMDVANPQEGPALQIGSQVCIDEHGRVGVNGAPIGILVRLDQDHHQAQIAVYGSEGGPPPLEVSRMVPDGVGFRVERQPSPIIPVRDFAINRPLTSDDLRQTMSMVDAQTLRVREQMRTEADARVFAALDQMIEPPNKKDPPKPEPRPVTKSRYERIMESFEPEK